MLLPEIVTRPFDLYQSSLYGLGFVVRFRGFFVRARRDGVVQWPQAD